MSMDPDSVLSKVLDVVKTHNKWRRLEAINLIPSENVMSPLAEYVYLNDMEGRYAEGTLGSRYYQGTKYIDKLEGLLADLMGQLFHARFVEVRPISGTIANAAVYAALTQPDATIMSVPLNSGGHISHKTTGAPGIFRLKVVDLPWNNDEFNIDVDKSIKLIKEVKPKIVILGGSVYLFPHPIKELLDAVHEVNAVLLHDSAHVLGLIAGGAFPNPLDLGADVMTSSTHKTFPGPQGGVIFTNREDLFRNIQKAVFPGLTSNYHHHRYAATAVTAIEMMKFGRAYAEQVVNNARALAEELHALGFSIVAENKGFTRTHQVLVDVSRVGGGTKSAVLLEEANIIVNKNALPWDRGFRDPSGLRLGVQEMTRFGMGKDEMRIIAEFMARVLIKREDPSNVRREVMEFRREFTQVKYGLTPKDVGIDFNISILM
ncbi:serine hydroxymethyltransferase [Vulcanisaeta souniana]|uniref:Serine hydroxymethyltransferase n=1 Tax=Vulcanisaeta souniana JCM 11219 TaxID=1293586 RepID=A0A830DZE9_9CREN|nr:serine hydroxymethyltransferase [Vulcanisaeta souniana]BDR91626.1 serine hydroxymethyltransferase [Vulcanisaeta souniana JCM 11219]GGI71798.1 serine hydroxymethyltransferase [Vulcanisaeta souniana JCM 11219]